MVPDDWKRRQSESVCFTKNTRALEQRKQAQVVVSRTVVNNALSCGLLNVRKLSNNGRNREEKDGGNDEDKRIDAGGHGRFVLTLCGGRKTAEVHSFALLHGLFVDDGTTEALTMIITVMSDLPLAENQDLA